MFDSEPLILPIITFSIVLIFTFVYWTFLSLKHIRLPPINNESIMSTGQHFMNGTAPDFLIKKLKELGMVFRLNMPELSYYIVIGDPSLAKDILENEPEKPSIYKRFNRITLDFPSIFTKKTFGENWEMNRKGIASSFSSINLNKTLPKLYEKCDNVLNLLNKYHSNDMSFEITDLMLSTTVDFIGEAMFGINLRCLSKEKNSIGKRILDAISVVTKEIVLKQGFNPFRHWMFWDKDVREGNHAAKFLIDTQKTIIEQYKSSHSPEELAKDSSILAHMIRCPYPSDGERYADMLTYLVAGHDTTAFSLSWIIIEVARNQDIQARLQQEILAIIPSDTKNIDTSLLSDLKFMDCVIKEGMRLWPVAALGSLRLASKDIPYKNLVIPKDSILMIPYYVVFRSADIKEPTSFLPDRWADDDPYNEKTILQTLSFPFSAGKRNCVGQNLAKLELKLVLATIFRNFRFELQGEFTKDYFLTLKPVNAMFKVYKL